MIAADYLANLRHCYRSELLLTLVQLEQVTPGWWLTLQDLADQLGTDRATLNHNLRKLEDRGLLCRISISNTGGTFVWWVKRHATDQPDPQVEPAWILRDLRRNKHFRVAISDRWRWAEQHQIPRPTMQGFLGGYQRVLRQRWELVSSPYDTLECQNAA